MPIRIPNHLPGRRILEKEGVPLILEERAQRQDIRPLQILILNLMPDKIGTETQLLRSLGSTPLQLDITFMHMASHTSKNTSQEHLAAFYKSHSDISDRNFDALIVTGAPLGLVDYKDVAYWDELTHIFDWARTHVYSSLFICWGALAALYHFHGVSKHLLNKKKTGIFEHRTLNPSHPITRGFDDFFYVPVSRSTRIDPIALRQRHTIETLIETENNDPCIVHDASLRHLYIFSHLEYDAETLQNEYERDKRAGLNPDIPDNYFPNNDPASTPQIIWRAHRTLLFTNWINTVYQNTPYDLAELTKCL